MENITYINFYNVKDFIYSLLLLYKTFRIISYPQLLLRRSFLINAWSISGTQENSESLKIFFVGNNTDLNYYSKIFFNTCTDKVHLGKMWPWSILFHLLRFKNDYDMLLYYNKINILNLMASKKCFIIPDWISCEIDLTSNSISSQVKKNIKKIKKYGYTYKISKDPNDFNFFYNKMYIPYVAKRHKNSLSKMSYETIKNNFENGELILINKRDKTISGGIINYSLMQGIPRGTQLGVCNGDFEYVKEGALVAYYYYAINYLKENGYKTFSLGGTRPFFNDGVLQHKLGWGAKIMCESSNAFLLYRLSNKSSLKKFFTNNPFICIHKKKPSLAVFTDNSSNDDKNLPISNIKKNAYGINDIIMVHL